MKKKLAIVSTHPIQYNAPFFKLLAEGESFEIKVFYTWSQSAAGEKYDPGFGKNIAWDIPLLEGYPFEFIANTSAEPGTHHFKGIKNPGLLKRIEAFQPELILIYGWAFQSHLRCLRYFHRRIPVLFRGDSTLLDETPGIKKGLRRLFLRWVYRHVDYALYAGKNNKAYFLAHGITEKQLIFVPHAVDNERFAGEEETKNNKARDWRTELSFRDTDLVILFAGKLEEKKNPFFILELSARISSDRVKWLIVGNGKLEAAIKKAAAADNRIRFLDFQNQQNMPVIYRIGDIFLLPSKGPGETWGLAVNEAMACSRPAMVSEKVGCAADLIREKQNGISFPLSDQEKCISFIQDILDDPAYLDRLKATAGSSIRAYNYATGIENFSRKFDRRLQ